MTGCLPGTPLPSSESPEKSSVRRSAEAGLVRDHHLEVQGLVVDGNKGCVLTWHEVRPTRGPALESHFAEIFEVSDKRIGSFDIYFAAAHLPGLPTVECDDKLLGWVAFPEIGNVMVRAQDARERLW